MPRNAWAKVYCDLLRHPKIIGRPDSDVRLFLGLILYAKEYAPETGVVPLSPLQMRIQFGVQAPLSAVRAALAYFTAQGVLLKDGDFVRIRDFAERQSKTDSEDAKAARQRAYYERNKGVILEKQKLRRSDATPTHAPTLDADATTTTAPTPHSHADVEVEVDLKSVTSSRGGVRGGEFTACESVDNSGLITESISESDRLEVRRLLLEGKGSEATALLAALKAAQMPDKIHKSQEPEATR